MRKLFFSSLILLFVSAASAQKKNIDQRLNLSGSIGSTQGTGVFDYVHNWQLGKKKKFEIGTGARLTSYFGQNQYFVTAPAKLTSGETGPQVLFLENIPGNIDSFLIARPQINSVNITFNLGYHITPKFYAGVNIDVIGFSFGGDRNGQFISTTGAGTIGRTESAKPTAFNILLISDNDRGSLNSEYFVRYQWNKKWAVRAGYQFLFTEYKTDTKVQQVPEPNDRFRNKVSAFTAGVSYKL